MEDAVKKLCLVSLAIAGVALMLIAHVDAQGRAGGAGRGGGGQAAPPAGGGGRVGAISVGGTPTVPDNQVTSQPIPRLPDGKVDLTGPWVGGGSNNNMEADAGFKPGELDAMLLPWARELKTKRNIRDEPYTACLPMGVPRVNPYPWKFAMSYTSKGLTHIYVLHETGDAGAHRVVSMDGRKHPVDPIPTWWGHSIGRFEKDTLVIDTIGYNDKFWFDARGTPHSEQLHTIERWTRLNYGTMTNDFTLDDPGAFSRTVQLKFTATHIRPDLDLMEFICLENNEYGIAGGIIPANEGGQRGK
jgi:hypothetical protein